MAKEYIRISDSPENSRELEWFLQRYPMVFQPESIIDRSTAQAIEHRDTETRLADLLAADAPPLTLSLAEPLRQYQSFTAQLLHLKRGPPCGVGLCLGNTVPAIFVMTLSTAYPDLADCPSHLHTPFLRTTP